jgi:hypothetical protein
MRRRTPAPAVSGLAVLALAAMAVPFTRSWRMNEAAKTGHLSVDLAAIPVGGYMTMDREQERIYVLRSNADKVIVLSVQLLNGEVYLPDSSRYRLMGPCHRFEPDSTGGQLTPGGFLHCLDPEAEPSYLGSSRWTFDGSAVKPERNKERDLSQIPFERFGNVITVTRSK